MNQADRVLAYMQDRGSITSLEAFRDIGCTRLSGRIFDLKRKGHKITSTLEKVPTRDGSAWVSVYRLEE